MTPPLSAIAAWPTLRNMVARPSVIFFSMDNGILGIRVLHGACDIAALFADELADFDDDLEEIAFDSRHLDKQHGKGGFFSQLVSLADATFGIKLILLMIQRSYEHVRELTTHYLCYG